MNPTNPRCRPPMKPIEDCGCTATGTVLAHRLLRLVPDLLAGDVPATIGRKLAAAVDKAEGQQRRMVALLGAVDALDPDGNLSLWHVSERLEDALERFQGAGYRRVRAGHRPPSDLEQHMIVLIEIPGPRCRESIYRELAQLIAPSQ